MTEDNRRVPVISVVAKSDAGKTTLLEKVIRELKDKGIRLAVIKHDAHSFEIDKPGKDSWRLAQAGADVVSISSPEKIAIIEKTEKELSLDEVISRISGVDLVLTEGFKRADKPKIEVFRSAAHRELLCEPEELLAIASDVEWNLEVPCFHIDDAKSIADFILDYMEKFNKSQA
ncbi:MAG: molybdopterin-guanine dinucleotide biosynthesis protein B [Peptococcaceae bacterium]|nr:molybdopterin-guanine dinucleotide biosynthesis protein B [Peptococcaceae bacterium]MDH7524984.1 molybdopterin-guanine dinucleotide biosynthesis protein B [Peptococcaceae bacterium]